MPLQEEVTTPTLHLQAYPNPSQRFFTLKLMSGSNKAIQLRIVDGVGKVIELKQGIAANSTIPVGHQYQPGIYFVEAVQEGEKAMMKLVKQFQ